MTMVEAKERDAISAMKALLVGGLSALAAALVLGFGPAPAMAQEGPMDEQMMKKMQRLVELAPGRGYIAAHKDVQNPLKLLGGPISVTVTQDGGGVFVALPDRRELGEHAFGTPDHPRSFAGSPGINGVPPMARGASGSAYTEMKMPSPFGDAHVVMPNGQLRLEALDATATDAATTEDEVRFRASWEDQDGNTYEVRCCAMVLAHGLEFPTFGGVATNHLLHGFTRLGTALMPTEMAYLAFWGMGEVRKNGEVVDRPRLVHGMLTEYVRIEGYQLAHDDEVTPTRTHFHLMVPPMMPNPEEGRFVEKPLASGFQLPNGMELPFWHVMFENIQVEADRGG